MSVRLGRRTARRVSIGLLGACGAALAVAFAVPAAREADLSATRTTTYRLPKRKLAPFARRFESTLPILEIVIAEESLPNPEDEPIPALMRVFDREGVNRPGAMPSALRRNASPSRQALNTRGVPCRVTTGSASRAPWAASVCINGNGSSSPRIDA